MNDSPVGCQSRSATKPAGANRALLGEPKRKTAIGGLFVLPFPLAVSHLQPLLTAGTAVDWQPSVLPPVEASSGRVQRRNRENRARATASGVSRPYFKPYGLQGDEICVSSLRALFLFGLPVTRRPAGGGSARAQRRNTGNRKRRMERREFPMFQAVRVAAFEPCSGSQNYRLIWQNSQITSEVFGFFMSKFHLPVLCKKHPKQCGSSTRTCETK